MQPLSSSDDGVRLFGNHAAFHFQAIDLRFRVGTDGDVFFKLSGTSPFAVVGHFDLAAFSGFDRFFGVDGEGASAGGNGLMDDQHAFACVGELEDACHRPV